MKSDAELIREIKKERKILQKPEQANLGPKAPGSLVPNEYPTMIYVGGGVNTTYPNK